MVSQIEFSIRISYRYTTTCLKQSIHNSSNMDVFIPTDITNLVVRLDKSCIQQDKYKNIKFVNAGGYGSIYNLYDIQLKENIVAKFMFLYSHKLEKKFKEETKLQKKMNQLEIGPKIFATKICPAESRPRISEYDHSEIENVKGRRVSFDPVIPHIVQQKKVGILFMNKWDGDIQYENTTFLKSNAKIISSILLKQIFTLHKHNYIHMDIHARNILYRKTSSKITDVTISDFGLMINYDLKKLKPSTQEPQDIDFYTNVFMEEYPVYFDALKKYTGEGFDSLLQQDPTYLDFAYLFSETVFKHQLKKSLLHLLKNNKDLFTTYHPSYDKEKIRFLYSVCSTKQITKIEYDELEKLLHSIFDNPKK